MEDERHGSSVQLEDIQVEESQRSESSTNAVSAETASWIMRAKILAWFSAIISVLFGFAGLVVAFWAESAALLGFAFELFLNVISSLIVLWRFKGDAYKGEETRQMYGREKRASILVAFFFLFFGVIILLQAIAKLVSQDYPRTRTGLIIIGVVAIAIYLPMAIMKLRVGLALDSIAVWKDAVCCFSVGCLCTGIVVSASVFLSHVRIWYIDGIVSAVVGSYLLSYGAFTLIKAIRNKHQWWTSQFWRPT